MTERIDRAEQIRRSAAATSRGRFTADRARAGAIEADALDRAAMVHPGRRAPSIMSRAAEIRESAAAPRIPPPALPPLAPSGGFRADLATMRSLPSLHAEVDAIPPAASSHPFQLAFDGGGGGGGGGESFPWSKMAFGYTILSGVDAGSVGIAAGVLRWHKPAGADTWEAAAATVEITATDYTVWAIFDLTALAGTALTIVGDDDYPVSMTDKLAFPLYKFDLAAGVVSLARIYHIGDIQVIPFLAP